MKKTEHSTTHDDGEAHGEKNMYSLFTRSAIHVHSEWWCYMQTVSMGWSHNVEYEL